MNRFLSCFNFACKITTFFSITQVKRTFFRNFNIKNRRFELLRGSRKGAKGSHPCLLVNREIIPASAVA